MILASRWHCKVATASSLNLLISDLCLLKFILTSEGSDQLQAGLRLVHGDLHMGPVASDSNIYVSPNMHAVKRVDNAQV